MAPTETVKPTIVFPSTTMTTEIDYYCKALNLKNVNELKTLIKRLNNQLSTLE